MARYELLKSQREYFVDLQQDISRQIEETELRRIDLRTFITE